MLRLMDKYPDFTFTCSQAQLLDYTKRFYPDLFDQIKKRVDEGMWENAGSMCVESDCNVTSGESLVRQILYDAMFEKENFGTRSTVAWLTDTFSFQPNIPRILRISGITGFYTYKIHWCRKTVFPYKVFRWRGIDGSKVTSAVTLERNCYIGNPIPDELRFAKEHNPRDGKFENLIYPYGWGDGGGGPTADMIENSHRLADFPGLPRTEFIRADKYFGHLSSRNDELPGYFGELYVENHLGIMTSQEKAKRNNRVAETGCQSDEKLAVLAGLPGNKPDWSVMRNCWKRVLTMQFHDILPGSSINAVYTEDSAGHELPENAVVADSDGNIIPTVVLDDKKTFLLRAELPALRAKAFKVSEGTAHVERNAEIHGGGTVFRSRRHFAARSSTGSAGSFPCMDKRAFTQRSQGRGPQVQFA